MTLFVKFFILNLLSFRGRLSAPLFCLRKDLRKMTFLGEQPQADFVGPFSFCYGQTCQKMGAVKSHEMGT